MGLFERFRNYETRYALTFLGFVLAILFGGLSVYQEFFQKNSPHLKFEVLSSANVFDVHEDVGNLEVIFNGVNLREKQQTLALITVRISNDGAAPITKGDYDDSAPLGIEVSRGVITKAEILSANNQYLTSHLTTTIVSSNSITFTPAIIEAGDTFLVKLLVINSTKTNLDVRAFGKIAGIKEFSIVDLSVKQVPMSFFGQVFAGSLWVQIVRTICYFMILPLLLIIIFLPFASYSSAKEKSERTKFAIKFRQENPKHPNNFDWIITAYIETGISSVIIANDLAKTPEKIGKALMASSKSFYIGKIPEIQMRNEIRQDIANIMVSSNVANRKGEDFVVDPDFQKFVENLTNELLPNITIGQLAQRARLFEEL